MVPVLRNSLFFAILTALLSPAALGSSSDSRLLSLVPPGAQIVAGFANQPGPGQQGRLLITTHNNRLDLEDFLAFAGADSKLAIDDVIEVAAAPAEKALSEHLLLVAGRFDRDRIFASMELNAARATSFLGQRVLLV